MNVSEAKFEYPVFGFEPDSLGWECANLDEMTECREVVLQKLWPESLELIDSSGRRWVVNSTRRTGRAGGWLIWFLSSLLWAHRCRIDFDLEPRPSVTLSEVQDRACTVMKMVQEPDDYTDERKAETAQLLADIRQTKSIAELAPVLNWPAFGDF